MDKASKTYYYFEKDLDDGSVEPSDPVNDPVVGTDRARAGKEWDRSIEVFEHGGELIIESVVWQRDVK